MKQGNDKPKGQPTPYRPQGPIGLGLDVENLIHKIQKHSIAEVFAETVYNLCLIANDHISGRGLLGRANNEPPLEAPHGGKSRKGPRGK